MKLTNFVAIASVIGGSFLIPVPAEATPIDCFELAKNFEIGETNFNENLQCKEGSLVMKYGEWCKRTQGVVCTVGRGWD